MLKMNNSSNCFLGSQKYAEYGKISETNPSPKFRPVGPFDWLETWCKNGKNEKIYKFRSNGLFIATNASVAPSNSGFFTLLLGDKGAASGKLWFAGKMFSFTGQFALDGTAQVLVPLGKGLTPLVMELQADLAGAAGCWAG